MIVAPSWAVAAIEPGGLAGVAAPRRGTARAADRAPVHPGEPRQAAAAAATAAERGHAGLRAALARQDGFGRGGQLLTALIHHMGGAPTSAYRGMLVDTTA